MLGHGARAGSARRCGRGRTAAPLQNPGHQAAPYSARPGHAHTLRAPPGTTQRTQRRCPARPGPTPHLSGTRPGRQALGLPGRAWGPVPGGAPGPARPAAAPPPRAPPEAAQPQRGAARVRLCPAAWKPSGGSGDRRSPAPRSPAAGPDSFTPSSTVSLPSAAELCPMQLRRRPPSARSGTGSDAATPSPSVRAYLHSAFAPTAPFTGMAADGAFPIKS